MGGRPNVGSKSEDALYSQRPEGKVEEQAHGPSGNRTPNHAPPVQQEAVGGTYLRGHAWRRRRTARGAWSAWRE